MGYSLWGLRELDLTERLSILKCHAAAKSLQSCPTLCDPMDCSLPGFSIHGILQARTLEWVAISFSIKCQFFKIVIYLDQDLNKDHTL